MVAITMENKLILEIIDRLRKDNIPLEWYSGRHVLITGGAGFIGSWLVEALSHLGSIVYIVDNLWRGSLQNITNENGDYMIPIKDQFILGDLCDSEVALMACKKSHAEIIFHLADIVAGIDFIFANEPFIFRSNLLINSNVISAAHELSIQKLVYLGTACSYPKRLQQGLCRTPLLEEEVYPADPESAYGWSKLMGEYELDLIAKFSNLHTATLRLQNVYGPRVSLSPKGSQVIPSLIRKAIRYPQEDFIVWGSGKQARDFVFVGDVIDAILRVPLKGMGKGVIQIGTAKETNVATLAEMIVRISGKKIPIKFDTTKPEGDLGRSGNYEKARQLLGWDVFTPIENGIEQTFNWAYDQIRNNRVRFDV
jgi:GDP-D-mannose 3',5'-epimerase